MNLAAESLSLNDLSAHIAPLLAALPRFIAAFAVLPLLRPAVVPLHVRNGLMLVLAILAYPGMEAPFARIDWSLWQWAGFALKEVFIGATIGYTMAIALWALGAVGELMDVQAGFANAQIFDPFGGHAGGPFSLLMSQLGVLFFIGFGGLHVMLQLLYESLLLWPPASFTPELSKAFGDLAIGASGSVLEWAARLASPVIGALLLVDFGLGLINRAAPQFNAFYFSMPVKALVSLLVVALMLAHLVDVVRPMMVDDAHQWMPNLDRAWGPR